MCGIAGFISNDNWMNEGVESPFDKILERLKDSTHTSIGDPARMEALQGMIDAFDDLMSFSTHRRIISGTVLRKTIQDIAVLLEAELAVAVAFVAEKGRTDAIEEYVEHIRDCLWQIEMEALGNVDRTLRLIPEALRVPDSPIGIHFTGWAVEQALENIDRLEVRGRDSAGISIQLLAPSGGRSKIGAEKDGCFIDEVKRGVRRKASVLTLTPDTCVYTFVYKIANLVGRLGDNTAGIREAISADAVLWATAAEILHVSIIAHTRWASNGIISLGNSHPADGGLYGPDHTPTAGDTDAQFVLNGDVDNYKALVEHYVTGRGFAIEPGITTDAKILPVLFRLGTDPHGAPSERFAVVMNGCVGSLAVVMQHPLQPRALFLGQKGSGQSLFIGKTRDGYILASEVYGLAARARSSYALSGTERGGTMVRIQADAPDQSALGGEYLDDARIFELKPERIYIHSRDIYRGDFNYYFEKEIFDAPESVRKTIRDKYRKVSGRIEFAKNGQETFTDLLSRIRDQERPPIRRITVIGQGTASIAAKGTAYLIERGLTGARIAVNCMKSSEMSGFLTDEPLSDMLLIAVSQSGTTTDTNRTVDVAGSQGAWIHSIVNRRNSPLVSKSDSHTYTSDGRDVEMAVASTKAFYSQIAAGKLIALLLAQEFQTLSPEEIYQDILELEELPSAIEKTLGDREYVRACAELHGPASRNWAVVGNGPNKIAADEIRIKLSELCYKSIPCDFTEDKKHIDLSTEPLTLVIANDLPEQIVQDTAKEVAIFKAHNGRPVVFAAKGETRFNEYAAYIIELPPIGAGLGFVVATVAGHLWGFYAAKAIDSRAEEFRSARAYLAGILEAPDTWEPGAIQAKLWEALRAVSTGELNASLPASTAAALGLYAAGIAECDGSRDSALQETAKGIGLLNKAIEEMTRPIDTIRHQAKTVTVGISRPQEILPPVLLAALESLSVHAAQIREQDRRMLRLASPIIRSVAGGLLYKAHYRIGDGTFLQTSKRSGVCEGKASRYDEPRQVGGSKRTALRLERAIWSSGPAAEENLLIVPLFDDESGRCEGLVLLHLEFQDTASLQQKLSLLRAMGARYDELIERLEEISGDAAPESRLELISPRDLLLAPVDTLAAQLRSSEPQASGRGGPGGSRAL